MRLNEIANNQTVDKLANIKKDTEWLTTGELRNVQALVKKLSQRYDDDDRAMLDHVLWRKKWMDPINAGFSVLMYTIDVFTDAPSPGELKITTFSAESALNGQPDYIENYSYTNLIDYFARVKIVDARADDNAANIADVSSTATANAQSSKKFSVKQKNLQKWILAKYEAYYRERNKVAPAIDFDNATIHSESIKPLLKWLKKNNRENLIWLFIQDEYTGKEIDALSDKIIRPW